MCKALEDLMQDVIKQREREAAEQAAINKTLSNIKSLMSTLKLTAEQAMDALQIPPSEQSTYMRKI